MLTASSPVPAEESIELHVKNPIAVDRPDTLVRVPLASLGVKSPASWEALVEKMPVPAQIEGTDLLLLLNLAPDQERVVHLYPLSGPAPRVVPRVQADLAVKSDGVLGSVKSHSVGPDHGEHDGTLAHEGPGWESDRAAYRLYLDKRAVTDLFGKKRPELVMHNVGRGADYHAMADWGMDILEVGESLGDGSIGVWQDGKARFIGPAKTLSATEIANGPILAGYDVKAEGLAFGGKSYDLDATYTIAAGSRLFEVVGKARGSAPLVAGIVKHKGVSVLTPADPKGRAWAYFASWGHQSLADPADELGLAFFYPVADIESSGDDGNSLYAAYADPAKPIRFFAGAAWKQELGGVADEAAFRRYLEDTAEALSHPPVVTVTAGLPKPAEILADIERVADWQIAHLDKLDYVDRYREESENPTGWVQGTLYLGLSVLADRSGEARYADAILRHDRMTDWSLSGPAEHADFQLIGQTYFWDYRRSHDPQAKVAILRRFDEVLAEHPDVPLDFDGEYRPDAGKPCQKRWCWSDALFMAPPTWATASRVTGDPRYLAYADQEMWATVQKLYDPAAHLFYRDTTQMKNKVFWSRGNGWVLAGLARFLDALPPDHPNRGRYEALFKEMAQRVMGLQTEGGTWCPSLLSGGKDCPPETSGTALFVYGLAWGVNHGLLDRNATLPVLIRGWSALSAAIRPDGRLGWVQRIGYAPDKVAADDTQLYGTGALLLAGAELSQGPVSNPLR